MVALDNAFPKNKNVLRTVTLGNTYTIPERSIFYNTLPPLSPDTPTPPPVIIVISSHWITWWFGSSLVGVGWLAGRYSGLSLGFLRFWCRPNKQKMTLKQWLCQCLYIGRIPRKYYLKFSERPSLLGTFDNKPTFFLKFPFFYVIR